MSKEPKWAPKPWNDPAPFRPSSTNPKKKTTTPTNPGERMQSHASTPPSNTDELAIILQFHADKLTNSKLPHKLVHDTTHAALTSYINQQVTQARIDELNRLVWRSEDIPAYRKRIAQLNKELTNE